MYRQLVSPNTHPKEILYNGRPIASWAGWCLAYVEVAFGTPRLYARAWHGWEAVKHRHTNRDFPRDVYFPVWFEHWGTYNGVYGNWGHVAICKVTAKGYMTLWSSPASKETAPDTYHSIADVERVYSSKFVGWSEDIAETRVITPAQGGGKTMTIEEFLNDWFDVMADDPHYATSKPEAFQGHVNHVSGLEWAQRRAWMKQTMKDYGVLNATHMAEHRAEDKKYRERVEAELNSLSSAAIQYKVDLETTQERFEQERLGWKQVEDSYRNDKAQMLLDHAKALHEKNQEIQDMQKLLDRANQNAQPIERWTIGQHLSAAIRLLFGKGGDTHGV